MVRTIRMLEYGVKRAQIENLLSTELFRLAKVKPASWYWDKPVSLLNRSVHIHLMDHSEVNQEVKRVKQALYKHFDIAYNRIHTFVRHPRVGNTVMDVMVYLDDEELLLVYLYCKKRKDRRNEQSISSI